MVEMNVSYKAQKNCELTHTPSGTVIQTDAPKDNGGRGERFSPTDLVGAALASCALTTMAIVGEREGIPFESGTSSARINKEMRSNPRRIDSLPLEITMPRGLSGPHRKRLEEIAKGCPVALSLHPDIQMKVTFIYLD